jgi:transposase
MDEPIELMPRGLRRRSWTVAEKLRIVAETKAAGASVPQVARRYDLNSSLIYTWRRMAEGREATPARPARLVPVRLAVADAAAVGGRQEAGRIEIGLPSGVTVAMGADVGPGRLAEVLAVVVGAALARRGEGR